MSLDPRHRDNYRGAEGLPTKALGGIGTRLLLSSATSLFILVSITTTLVYVDINLRQPVQSWAARRAHYAQVIERGGFHVSVHPDDIQIRGDFAFVRGALEPIRSGVTGDSARTELRYLEIVRRQTDSSWQVMWGMDGPIPEYTPE